MFQRVVESAKLVSLPDIYVKLKALLEDPDFTMAEVAILVGRDPGMATRFLQVVNCPMNRRVEKIETVSHAVSLLGIQQIHDIVLGAAVTEVFEGLRTDVMDVRKFWQQSYYCAVMTKQLGLECKVTGSERLVVIGLLHDIGHLFMYMAIPKETQKAIVTARKRDRPLYQVERELLGFDYAELGAYMMREWDLPRSLQTTTCFHPEPSKADEFALETALLHLSSLSVRSAQERGDFGGAAFPVDPTAWLRTRLREEQRLRCLQRAGDQFSEVAASLFL